MNEVIVKGNFMAG